MTLLLKTHREILEYITTTDMDDIDAHLLFRSRAFVHADYKSKIAQYESKLKELDQQLALIHKHLHVDAV